MKKTLLSTTLFTLIALSSSNLFSQDKKTYTTYPYSNPFDAKDLEDVTSFATNFKLAEISRQAVGKGPGIYYIKLNTNFFEKTEYQSYEEFYFTTEAADLKVIVSAKEDDLSKLQADIEFLAVKLKLANVHGNFRYDIAFPLATYRYDGNNIDPLDLTTGQEFDLAGVDANLLLKTNQIKDTYFGLNVKSSFGWHDSKLNGYEDVVKTSEGYSFNSEKLNGFQYNFGSEASFTNINKFFKIKVAFGYTIDGKRTGYKIDTLEYDLYVDAYDTYANAYDAWEIADQAWLADYNIAAENFFNQTGGTLSIETYASFDSTPKRPKLSVKAPSEPNNNDYYLTRITQNTSAVISIPLKKSELSVFGNLNIPVKYEINDNYKQNFAPNQTPYNVGIRIKF